MLEWEDQVTHIYFPTVNIINIGPLTHNRYARTISRLLYKRHHLKKKNNMLFKGYLEPKL